jgi:hypothetical protein
VALGPGWRPGANQVWGEWDTRVLLAGELPATVAAAGASGWDGGRLRTFERDGQVALVLRTVWDSQFEAREFCGDLARWATARFGAAKGSAGRRWSGRSIAGTLACSGSRAVWLSAPDPTTLARLAAAGGTP